MTKRETVEMYLFVYFITYRLQLVRSCISNEDMKSALIGFVLVSLDSTLGDARVLMSVQNC